MGAIIYAVTRGKYSDYGVIACFSTKADADAYAAEENDTRHPYENAYHVEEFDLNPPLPSLVKSITSQSDVQFAWSRKD